MLPMWPLYLDLRGHNLIAEAELVGLCINEDKTKYKHIKRANQRNILLHINNFSLEKVCNFIYLDSLFNDSNMEMEKIT
jgi:hypothetical protein